MSYELDLLEEKRDLAALRTASYKQPSERYFNSKVKEKRFKEGDFVLRKVLYNTKEVNAGVLEPNWEGPYRIAGVLERWCHDLGMQNSSGLIINNVVIFLSFFALIKLRVLAVQLLYIIFPVLSH